MTDTGILKSLHAQLDWPEPPEIFNPRGAGPRVYARLAKRKLAEPLRLRQEADVGVLTSNPTSEEFESPFGIVCQFPHSASPATLRELHKLAWNFCRSPLLITLEPHLIRAWSCYETPSLDGQTAVHPIGEFPFDRESDLRNFADSLHWIELVSGHFVASRQSRFPSNQRADETLLQNLTYLRERLTAELPEEVVHDLLARLIFVQFLCDRKDSAGKPALDQAILHDLHQRDILSQRYSALSEILQHKADTYALFNWLDDRFNGDFFPDDWRKERKYVKATHLRMLSQFVGGSLMMRSGQRSLWPLYSFDAIPLEFVSSIYEQFVTGVGVHYTPAHVVDFMLDRVLPWGGTNHDVRVLDPACGSGIFLVKVFQRLVNRWRNAHWEHDPPPQFLRSLLENNLYGVDLHARAVHVASFSLYLAMCDEIDPRHYWRQVRFPRLREVTLRTADFFREDIEGIRCADDARMFDLVVGNAPWGDTSLTDTSREWAKQRGWTIADEQIGPLFLPKALDLTADDGAVAMIQPAGSLLFNRSSTALQARKRLFSHFQVDEVINLSALRFHLFPSATGPGCIITMRPREPYGEPIAYFSPKQSHQVGDEYRVTIDSHDLNWVMPQEAARDPEVWSALTWGGRRDLELVRRLTRECDTLAKKAASGDWQSRAGFIRGADQAKECHELVGIQILDSHELWDDCQIVESVDHFPCNENPRFERPRSLETYALPLLLTKQSWTVSNRRFRAIIVRPTYSHMALLFSFSFIGVHAPDTSDLATLALVVNSSLAVHFLYLSSGRLASYRPTLRKVDFEQIPLPIHSDLQLDELKSLSPDEIDNLAFELFNLAPVERILVEDFVNFTLSDFKDGANSMGRQPCTNESIRIVLHDYCTWFMTIVKSGFGQDKAISATIYSTEELAAFPYCIAAFHLDVNDRVEPVEVIELNRDQARQLLSRLESVLGDEERQTGGIFHKRVARVYTSTLQNVESPSIVIVKPNEQRYWTRSVAMRDADEVSADIVQWNLAAAT